MEAPTAPHRMSASIDIGTRKAAHSSASHASVLMFISRVRLALETSVTNSPPALRFHTSHESIVPNTASPDSAAARRPGTFSSIHSTLDAVGRPRSTTRASTWSAKRQTNCETQRCRAVRCACLPACQRVSVCANKRMRGRV
jgi:hypothetical protein